jgi:hypothetical protein
LFNKKKYKSNFNKKGSWLNYGIGTGDTQMPETEEFPRVVSLSTIVQGISFSTVSISENGILYFGSTRYTKTKTNKVILKNVIIPFLFRAFYINHFDGSTLVSGAIFYRTLTGNDLTIETDRVRSNGYNWFIGTQGYVITWLYVPQNGHTRTFTFQFTYIRDALSRSFFICKIVQINTVQQGFNDNGYYDSATSAWIFNYYPLPDLRYVFYMHNQSKKNIDISKILQFLLIFF